MGASVVAVVVSVDGVALLPELHAANAAILSMDKVKFAIFFIDFKIM
jgi:hypothetical protein